MIQLYLFIVLAEKKNTSEATLHHKCLFFFFLIFNFKLEIYEQELSTTEDTQKILLSIFD